MKKGKYLYNPLHKLSSVFMLLALLWLTVSIPFVYADQQQQKELKQKTMQLADNDDNSNPLTNTNEEKSEGGVNTLSEYLHEAEITDPVGSPVVTFYKCHSSDLYFAFHPELISPPPEA